MIPSIPPVGWNRFAPVTYLAILVSTKRPIPKYGF